MPNLTFEITSAEPKPFALVPTLVFKLRINNAVPDEEIYSAALKGQVIIEAVHRDYDAATRVRLVEVFGEPGRWDETLNSVLWTNVTVPLPRFTGSTVVDVPIPCTADVEVAAGKYFLAIREGVVPLAFLFSGTIFYKGAEGALLVTQLPWEKEAPFKLSIKLWRDLLEQYHPNSTWLRLRNDTFEKLAHFRAANAIPTLDECLDRLVDDEAVLDVMVKGGRMNTIEGIGPSVSTPHSRLEDITRALLYEGYSLFPYHRTSIKNVKPVPFGVVYPEAYSRQHPEAASVFQTECLVKGHGGDDVAIQACLHFLQLCSIEFQEWTEQDAFRPVESLQICDEIHRPGWQAIERELKPESPALWRCAADWTACRIEFPESHESRLLYEASGKIVGRRFERVAAVTGRVTMAYFPVEAMEDCYQITVRIGNTTPVANAADLSRDEITPFAFLSTHTILTVTGGEFLSVLEPDDAWQPIAAQCRNIGTWPILVDRNNATLLSSPIILHDYPEIAAQSQGDLFDCSEIEEALILHLAAMSDDEKKTLADSDERLRAMLERVSQVTPQELLNLHGALREVELPERMIK